VVRERVIRECTSSAQYPMLTQSNYAEWPMVVAPYLLIKARYLCIVLFSGSLIAHTFQM
jgi:hypothetical protein